VGIPPTEGTVTLVSVVTCAHNAERYVGEAIESIRAQTYEDFEYILVDDCSTDRTLEIFERYARSDRRIRAIRRTEQGGPYVAANDGFSAARGRYIARLDADDISVPHRLERQLAFLESRPDLRACASDISFLDSSTETTFHDDFPSSTGAVKWRLFFRTFMPSTTLVERSAWADVGGFRALPLSQDLRFWCDLARRGWLGFVGEPLVFWRRHEQQLSEQRYELQQTLADDVLLDHVAALGGSDWTKQDIGVLRWIGVRPIATRAAWPILDRFEALWRRDDALTGAEREELAAFTVRLRSMHRRVVVKDRLGTNPLGRTLIEAQRRVRRFFHARPAADASSGL
jgi:glycosyltransferase involved in cell wall biosynthesis